MNDRFLPTKINTNQTLLFRISTNGSSRVFFFFLLTRRECDPNESSVRPAFRCHSRFSSTLEAYSHLAPEVRPPTS
jgi:hypothetical protein